MKNRLVWMLPVMACFVCWFEPAYCSAQEAPAQLNPVILPDARSADAGPPSTVSPVIARFLKQTGRDQPASVPASVPVPDPTPPPLLPTPPGSEPKLDDVALPPLPSYMRTAPGDTTAIGYNPLATGMQLKAAPLVPGDMRFPINLATALRLSDARPLIVAAAQASVWVAEAELTRAKVLWVPMLNLGFDYTRHDGPGPDINKGIMTTPASVNFLYGGGGLIGMLPLTDAIFEPLVARQILNARHYDVQTSKNDAMLRTADAYFRVHQARGTYAGALYTVERGRDLVDRIRQLSVELVPKVEVERARNILAELEQRAAERRQEWRIQSANLTQVLRLDPRAVVEPLEHDHTQITLIDPARPLDELMIIALKNRPELGSHQALVLAAEAAIRREKNRPLIPTVMLNGFQTPGTGLLQAGVFGLGTNSSLNQFTLRDDVSFQLLWQIDAFGIGNQARVKAQRGQQSHEIIEFRRAQDMVAAEVNRAYARVQSATARVLQADRALRTGIITFNGNFEGVSQTTRFGNVLVLAKRPQEAVYALQLLYVAFNEYMTTVSDYNRAQFELFHAMGYPAREISSLRLPGDVMQVDTARPDYLPPVGSGPPPATR